LGKRDNSSQIVFISTDFNPFSKTVLFFGGTAMQRSSNDFKFNGREGRYIAEKAPPYSLTETRALIGLKTEELPRLARVNGSCFR
jgi:hypothetical protein